jgi:hypothetical protein
MQDGGSGLPATDEGRPSPVRWVVAAHAVLFTVVLCSAWYLPISWVPMVLVAGVGFAQAGLLSIWLVLGRGPSAKRLVLVALLPVLLVTLPVVAFPMIFLSLPFIMMQSEGMQVRRVAFGSLPPPRAFQFSMRQLTGAMIIVAVLFGLGQFVPPSREELFAARLGELGGLFSAMGIAVVGLTCAAIVLTIPVVCVWAVLVPGRVLPRFGVAAFGWSLGAVLAFHLAGGAWQGAAAGVAIAGVSAVVLTVTLYCLRIMGYRMIGANDDTARTANGSAAN